MPLRRAATLCAAALITCATTYATDLTSSLQLVGNPFNARFGTGPFTAKQIHELFLHDNRIFIGAGSSNNRGGTDLWSLRPSDQTFQLEISRTHQEEMKQFRLLEGRLFVNDEDFDRTGSNIHIYQNGQWSVKFLQLPAGSPGYWDISASGHNRDVYYMDGRIFSTALRPGTQFNKMTISSDGGNTWRLATTNGGIINHDVHRFFRIGSRLYALSPNHADPIYRYPGSNGRDFDRIFDNGSAAGFPTPSWAGADRPNNFHHTYEREFNGALYYMSTNRLFRLTRFEPQTDAAAVSIPGYTNQSGATVNYIAHPRHGRLRVLVNVPITSGTLKYRTRAHILETTNGTDWTHLFSVVSPAARLRFHRFETDGTRFYFATEISHHYFDAQQPTASHTTAGNVYRVNHSTPVAFSGIYSLINKSDNKALRRANEVYTPDSAGNYVISFPQEPSVNSQQWTFSAAGAGFHRLVNRQNNRSLHASAQVFAQQSAGNYTITYPTASSGGHYERQRWQIIDHGAGFFRLVNKHDGKALHRSNQVYSLNSSGNYVITFNSDPTSDRQMWKITR